MEAVESIRVSYRALRQNLLRSFLAVLGIIIGVAVVVTILAIGNGTHAQIAAQLRTLGTNLLYVLPQGTDSGGTPLKSSGRRPLTMEDAISIAAEVPNVTIAAPMVSGNGSAVKANRNWSTTIVGTTPDFLDAREWQIDEGRIFDADEVKRAAKVAVIGSTVAKKLFMTETPIGQILRVENVPLQVIGVLKPKGQDAFGWDQDDVIYTPITTAKLRITGYAQANKRRAVSLILVKVATQQSVEPVAEAIRELMRQRHRLQPGAPDDFDVKNMEALIEQRDETAKTLTLQLGALASVALLVGGIAIMNIMIVSVTERTREIGLRMAVGARQKDIRNQFLIEALILCLIGGVVGTALGIGLAQLFSWLGGWPVVISLVSIVLAVCSAGIVGLVFGLYPAQKASLLDPIEALRHE